MAIQLTLEEMLEVLDNLKHPHAEMLRNAALDVTRVAANCIAIHTGTECTSNAIELWDGHIMAGFSGKGPIPEVLKGYDDEGWEE